MSTYRCRDAITVFVVARGFREKPTCLYTPDSGDLSRAPKRNTMPRARTFDDEDITRSSVSTTLSYDENIPSAYLASLNLAN